MEEIKNIKIVDLKKTMENSYIDYAMSVIASRALPDVRDGLKPVQRRILFSMTELNNTPDKPHRKAARIVGDTMGKYHPHGDSSIYGALVGLAQDWNTRYPLIDGHGNFGSIDGDGAAAMRYTEARLSKISMEMLRDLGKDTVDFAPNFDETEKEPTVLPGRIPNLLINGTTGIAVGMATNIPPHNLGEVIDGVVTIIDNKVVEGRNTEVSELMDVIKAPDFPTGATIFGTSGIRNMYETGRGKIKVRATAIIEEDEKGKNKIVVTELPYLVNKSKLIEKIAYLSKEKEIDGITDVNDYSDRDGIRIVIDLRKDANARVILNLLYKKTQMEETFGAIMLALNNGVPKVMNLKEILEAYLNHQENVVRRRCEYDLNKARDKAHILEGFLIALDNIDRVIKIIRGSYTTQEAKTNLENEFNLSEKQSQAIVDMRLRALTGLEREKIEEELKELEKLINYLLEILGDNNKLLNLIKEEILEIKEKFSDPRRTKVEINDEEFESEDLIPREDIIITLTEKGYIKRMNKDTFKAQGRGGKGIKGGALIEDDFIKEIFMSSTHDFITFFTNKGRAFKLKGYQIGESSRNARGLSLVNLLSLENGESVTSITTVNDFNTEKNIVFVTKKGIIKKVDLSLFKNIRKKGLIAINLRENDELVSVFITEKSSLIYICSNDGKMIVIDDEKIRQSSRVSQGVRGIRLKGEDKVISAGVYEKDSIGILVSEKGYGKRMEFSEFNVKGRGGMGNFCYKPNEKTGKLVKCLVVEENDEIMIINNKGIVIRIKVNEVSTLGRTATGVKLINISESDTLVTGVSKVINSEEDIDILKVDELSDNINHSLEMDEISNDMNDNLEANGSENN